MRLHKFEKKSVKNSAVYADFSIKIEIHFWIFEICTPANFKIGRNLSKKKPKNCILTCIVSIVQSSKKFLLLQVWLANDKKKLPFKRNFRKFKMI